jgi:hypothetical protein
MKTQIAKKQVKLQLSLWKKAKSEMTLGCQIPCHSETVLTCPPQALTMRANRLRHRPKWKEARLLTFLEKESVSEQILLLKAFIKDLFLHTKKIMFNFLWKRAKDQKNFKIARDELIKKSWIWDLNLHKIKTNKPFHMLEPTILMGLRMGKIVRTVR